MTTPSQAKNYIGRALLHEAGIRFSEKFEKRCRGHFKGACCYCGLTPSDPQHGHFDHATPLVETPDTFHLVYACRECNSNEKRGRGWEEFLYEKVQGDEAKFQARRQAILDWFDQERPAQLSPEAMKAVEDAKAIAISGFESARTLLRQRLDQL